MDLRVIAQWLLHNAHAKTKNNNDNNKRNRHCLCSTSKQADRSNRYLSQGKEQLATKTLPYSKQNNILQKKKKRNTKYQTGSSYDQENFETCTFRKIDTDNVHRKCVFFVSYLFALYVVLQISYWCVMSSVFIVWPVGMWKRSIFMPHPLPL